MGGYGFLRPRRGRMTWIRGRFPQTLAFDVLAMLQTCMTA